MSKKRVSRSVTTIDTYIGIINSYRHGYLRLVKADTAWLRLSLALLTFRSKPRGPFEGNEYEDLLHSIRSITRDSFDSLQYVTDVSQLVYATTLFDTFLTDTSVFLFLLIPDSMGKDLQIPLSTIITATSRNAALQQIATTKAREISFRTFEARLQFLRTKFGLPIKISDEELAKLRHYTDIRNSAVHDQGILEFSLNKSGSVSSKLKTCPMHPTQFSSKERDDAPKLYSEIFEIIVFDMLTHVLKVDPALISEHSKKARQIATSIKAPSRRKTINQN